MVLSVFLRYLTQIFALNVDDHPRVPDFLRPLYQRQRPLPWKRADGDEKFEDFDAVDLQQRTTGLQTSERFLPSKGTKAKAWVCMRGCGCCSLPRLSSWQLWSSCLFF